MSEVECSLNLLRSPLPFSVLQRKEDARLSVHLYAEVHECRADRDEPHRKRGDKVEIEPEHDEIEGAMDRAMQCAKHYEDPRGVHVHRIYLIRDKEIEHERIEEHWNLEQVLEVVRWIGHLGRRELREYSRGQFFRTELIAYSEVDPTDVHIHPHQQRQKYGREERTKDCVL